MAYPRQKLYDVNHSGYVSASLFGTLNNGDKPDFAREINTLTGLENTLPLSRGRLGAYFGVKHNVSDRRRKVILSAFTICDLINMVVSAGGEPEFCDVAPYSPHLTAAAIEKLISEETAAVIVTHYHTSNPQIGEIADLCAGNDITLIEDCAISLGSRPKGAHVGAYGDVAFFSFGLFKFISTYFGGAVWFRSDELRQKVVDEMDEWPNMTTKDLWPYFTKGVKMSTLTNRIVFNSFTFPIFRYGYMNDIKFIKNQAKNDPNPRLCKILPENYKRRASDFQIREWIRQIPAVEENKNARLKRARIYNDVLRGHNSILIPETPKDSDCFLNFPILVSGDRDAQVKTIIKHGFDVATHYYRNCARTKQFADFHRPLANLERFVDQVIVLPTYPSLPLSYVRSLANFVAENVSE